MTKQTNLSEIDFDFIDYYRLKLTAKGAKAHFKFLVINKLGHTRFAFEKWIYRENVPGSVQVQMIDLINDERNCLPKYK